MATLVYYCICKDRIFTIYKSYINYTHFNYVFINTENPILFFCEMGIPILCANILNFLNIYLENPINFRNKKQLEGKRVIVFLTF